MKKRNQMDDRPEHLKLLYAQFARDVAKELKFLGYRNVERLGEGGHS